MTDTMREHRVNSSRLVHAPSLLELAKETYVSKGFVASYELVYNMFPDISHSEIEQILNGSIESYTRGNTVIVFLDLKE